MCDLTPSSCDTRRDKPGGSVKSFSFEAAYLDTDSVVQDRAFVLRIGVRSVSADRLLCARRRRHAVFVTADNPFSRPVPDLLNRGARVRLRQWLRRRGIDVVPGLGRARRGGWPPEHSLLAIGADAAMARRLCRLWRQNAVVLVTRQRAPELVWHDDRPR